MIYFTTLQGRYHREQETMTTPQPLHKEHGTSLQPNIQLQKAAHQRLNTGKY